MVPQNEIPFELQGKRVWVTGHRGMLGAAVVRRLAQEGCTILTATRAEADLCRQEQVEAWVARNRPEVVFAVAAKVGGIMANRTYPGDFVYDNLMIEANVIHASREAGVQKLLHIGSNCNYPKHAPQPIHESALLTGPLDESIKWYAVAKIAGILLCQSYRKQHGFDAITVMPPNLFGPGDNYDPVTSHVSAGILRRIHEAKASGAPTVEIWGSGQQRREFLFVDDLADALVFVMRRYSDDEIINIGAGQDMTIAEFARVAAEVIGYEGEFVFDRSKPEGTPRKILDCAKLTSLGWKANTDLRSALRATYDSFLASVPQAACRTPQPN